MKKSKLILILAVVMLACFALTACSPKNAKGAEVSRIEWVKAIEYIEKGLDEKGTGSFTANMSLTTYNKKQTANGDVKFDMALTSDVEIKVTKKAVYMKGEGTEYGDRFTYTEKSYVYIDKTDVVPETFISQDGKEWFKDNSADVIDSLSSLSYVIRALDSASLKYNKKTKMYEALSADAQIKAKFKNKNLIYVSYESDQVSSMGAFSLECSFKDYLNTEIKQSKPVVEKNKLAEACDKVKEKLGSYVTIKTDDRYSYVEVSGIEMATEMNTALLLDSTVTQNMTDAKIADGRKEYSSNGVTVSWIVVDTYYGPTIQAIYVLS